MKSIKKLILFCIMVAASAVMFSVTAFAATTVTGGSFTGRLDGHTGEACVDRQVQWNDSAGTAHYILRYDWVTDTDGQYDWAYPITVAMNGPIQYGPTYTLTCPWLSVHKTPPDITENWNTGAWHNTIDDMTASASCSFASARANGRGWSSYINDNADSVGLYVSVNKTASYQLAGHWIDGSGGTEPIYPQFYLDGQTVIDENLRSWAGTSSNGAFHPWTNYYEYADLKWVSMTDLTYNQYNQGYNKINILACDNYGNINYKEYPFYYDSVAPNIYFNSNPSGWTGGNPTFSFGAWDATSGVAHIWYRTTSNGSNWSGWTESSSCTIYNSGWYQVQVMSCDNAGNYSTVTSNWVGVDHALPTCSYSPNSSGWTNNLNVSISSWDTWGSGLSSSYWRLSTDGGNTWSGYTQFGSYTTVSLPQGDDVLQTDVYDNVGNKQTITSGHFYIDKSPPSATFSPNSCSWRGTPFDVTLQPTDTGGSGVKSYIYRISSDNGNTWGGWSAVKYGSVPTVVTLTGSGFAVIQAQITDNAGNVGTVTSGLYQLGITMNINLQPPNVSYLTDTDVITSAKVKDLNDGGITPDMNATVQLTVKKSDGSVYTTQSKAMVCPGNDSNLIWFRWHTPAAADTLTITATISCSAATPSSVLTDTMNWSVKVPTENTPPATAFTDKPPTWFSVQSPPGSGLPSSLSWSDYIYQGGTFIQRKYTAALSASLSTTPSKTASGSVRIETATDTGGVWQMKSGYPVNEQATSGVTVTSATGSAADAQCTTPAQLAEGRYPEFNYWYGGYFRLFEPINNGSFQLRQNPYSQYKDRVHYSPVWFPDGPYTTLVTVSQAWTPAGAMGTDATDTLQISGALPQDWYVRILQ